MHESAMIESVMATVEQKAKEYDVEHILKIKLKVGKLTCLATNTLINCFNAVADEDDLFKGCVMEVEEVPLKAECHQCHQVFCVEDNKFFCPECGHKQIKIVAGKEFLIQSIEVDKEVEK